MKLPLSIDLISRIARTPISVLGVRAAQEARLAAMQLTRRWPRLERHVDGWWTPRRVRDYIAESRHTGSLIVRDGPLALFEACERDLVDAGALVKAARCVRRREFKILGSTLPREGSWPWHADWRFDHAWPPAYFRSYSHYETGRPRA